MRIKVDDNPEEKEEASRRILNRKARHTFKRRVVTYLGHVDADDKLHGIELADIYEEKSI